MTFRAAVLVPVVVVALSACGSTALRGTSPSAAGAVAQGGAVGLDSPDGATRSGTSVPGGSHVATGGTSAAPQPSAGSGGAGGAAGQASSQAGPLPTGSIVGSAPGSTDKTPIQLGVVGTDNGQIAAAFGKKGVAWDTSPKKIVSFLNQTGGVGGRQLHATYFGADSAADASTNGQKACSALTEDHHVDIVVNVGMLGDVLPACLKQRGIALFDAAGWFADAAVMRQYPNWIVPNAITLDRSVRAILQSAASRGALKAGAKIGVIAESCPWAARVIDGTVRPLATQYGVSVDSTSVKCISNILADLVPVQSDVQRGVLQLKAAGATHVLVLSQAEAFVFAQFTGQASQQRYFPKYLISSNAYPAQNSADGAVITVSQDARPNLLGLGTLPRLDIGDAAKPATSGQSASQARCTKADPTRQGAETNSFALNTFYGMCDTFYAMKQSVEAAGLRLSYPDVTRGWSLLLRRRTPSAVLTGGVWAGRVGQLDGTGYAQAFAYNASKKQYQYVGAPVRVS